MQLELLERALENVKKPARYVGGEQGSIIKDAEKVKVRYAFAFPDVYDVGMSHLGLHILYHVLNLREDTWCERVFAPWPDMEQQMREKNIPLYTMESKTPVVQCDIIGFTLQYEMCYTNILNMLDLAGIPLRSCSRNESHPLVIAGGPCACNPEPLAPFVDVFFVGEGEYTASEMVDVYIKAKESGLSREQLLKNMAAIPGCYVPALYEHRLIDGVMCPVAKEDAPPVIYRQIIPDIDDLPFPTQPIVPWTDIVHDRVTLEIFRGCTHGCRFCQAGMIYRPIREKSIPTLVRQAAESLAASGYEEVSMVSLSSGDYSGIYELIEKLLDQTEECNTSLSLPSLRADSDTKKLMNRIADRRKTGLTLAPEAGTQRLRDVINKNITSQGLMKSVTDAFEQGWDRVKLYFMIGLPTETYEDLDGIVQLARDVREAYYSVKTEGRRPRLTISVSASTFVPKPHTPFQWCEQEKPEVIREKQAYLSKALSRIPGVTFSWSEPQLSIFEAVFARGDIRLADVLEDAWRMGSRFDAWMECFNGEIWDKAMQNAGYDAVAFGTGAFELSQTLPWQHIDCGVLKAFLQAEYEAAQKGICTPDCREGCLGCGIARIAKGVSQCE